MAVLYGENCKLGSFECGISHYARQQLYIAISAAVLTESVKVAYYHKSGCCLNFYRPCKIPMANIKRRSATNRR